ncbi:MAG: hypothetical protein WC924_03205 [Candidatus Gracilibacteria bacterium]
MKIDRKTKSERSLFLMAIIPMKKAAISIGTATPTVKSHQGPSSKVTRLSSVNIKKTAVNPTDHLPNWVSGNKAIFFFIIRRGMHTIAKAVLLANISEGGLFCPPLSGKN